MDSRIDFLSPVSLVPGFGPKRITALNESGIETVGDLLRYFPRRYIDRSTIIPLKDIGQFVDQTCSVIGVIKRTRVERGRGQRFRIQIDDGTGTMEALWFHGIPYLRAAMRTGMRILMTGKAGKYANYQMVHPQVENIKEDQALPEVKYLPQYRLTEAIREAGVGQKILLKSIQWLLQNVKQYPRVLPPAIEQKKQFPPLQTCIHEVHTPSNITKLEPYQARIRYEEVYTTVLTLHWSRRKFNQPGRMLKPGNLVDAFIKRLPFTLTGHQQKSIEILINDSASSHRMHRLLQGDVGAGKTVVAFCACLPALNTGLQAAWLSPTEVLAYQSFNQISRWLEPLGIKAALYTGAITGRDRQNILADLKSGRLKFIVGTHALIQPGISFSKLGMVVIDEQQRFGVDQRMKLQEKDPASDFLLMSATPIPQTLAQTLYGDLELVTIAERPSGRLPVSTHIVPKEKRNDMEQFVLNEITHNNAQAYYVVPRIEKDDDEESDLKDVLSTFHILSTKTFHSVPCALVHGGLPTEEKEKAVRDFASGKIKLLVATTVIEVGIDAPGATIIIIENAERFGLSQLHQLRGRVGRSDKKSWCFLLHEPTDDGLAQDRLHAFCTEHDGFKIAEMDLRFRGPGQMAGMAQAGWDDPRMQLVLDNLDLFREIQEEVEMTLKSSKA